MMIELIRFPGLRRTYGASSEDRGREAGRADWWVGLVGHRDNVTHHRELE